MRGIQVSTLAVCPADRKVKLGGEREFQKTGFYQVLTIKFTTEKLKWEMSFPIPPYIIQMRILVQSQIQIISTLNQNPPIL